ncbi:MAG: DNA gyrase inhibitor YacG [Alteromonadaceae bacterium]|uniref:DNA gyrase inhibitor YacG n=1 Tax=unclassified Marinobacter TaxID=83889 RepID=UPI000C353FC9|nr:DNA gyrase inhibitor YacG [Marinobacter sp. BGYM27]MAA66137.1 DNA gyrase inhibitor YacG [Alteromonadaceae bacterium]MBH86394.1 DNA gyrase inhibitor YacG [Alteromonadaceae bacterium]MDG5499231.1 DNA gyrase inhibitor YacG [Marinobacter sp. BGYM27]|tara:strand:- start:834 stop:1031 length:198 start_codon:yes stop_codon:yes gene_type:complete
MLATCPTCKKEVEWDTSNPHRPFCCERCKLIDLGAWANEDFRIPAEPADPEDLRSGDDQPDDFTH